MDTVRGRELQAEAPQGSSGQDGQEVLLEGHEDLQVVPIQGDVPKGEDPGQMAEPERSG